MWLIYNKTKNNAFISNIISFFVLYYIMKLDKLSAISFSTN